VNNPEHVPKLRDPRLANWDRLDPTYRQLTELKRLLAREGVDPEELYGRGFTSVDHLSRWSVSWGIDYLRTAEEARFINQGRDRVERERQEDLELSMKSMIAAHFRSRRG